MVKESKLRILVKMVICAFLPTFFTTGCYVIIGFSQTGQRIPAIFLFFLCVIVLLLPIELGIICKASKKKYGKAGLEIVLNSQEKMPKWKILFYGLCFFALAGLFSITILTWEDAMMSVWNDRLFAVLPAYFHWTDFEFIKSYPRKMLIVTCVIYFIMNGFIAPITEELYFRGYLTARLQEFGKAAPAIVTVLFSLYHFWLPFQNLFRICIFLPVSYFVWKKKNIYIAMVFHCTCNIFSCISFIIAVLG